MNLKETWRLLFITCIILNFSFVQVTVAAQGWGGAQLDITILKGTDPDVIINTTNEHRVTPNSKKAQAKTFLLLNIGTEQFFNMGGAYGRHASLKEYGIYLWIFNNSTTQGTYNIRTLQNYAAETTTNKGNPDNKDSYVQYIDDAESHKSGLFLECSPTSPNQDFGWKFEKAEGYSETNKIYKISTYGGRYLTASPDDANGNFCVATAVAPQNPAYQVWKLVTIEEYFELYSDSPSNSDKPIDATFLLQNPDFSFNKTNVANWGVTKPDDVRFGTEGYYKKSTEAYYKGEIYDDSSRSDDYLYENGKYFCVDIKGSGPTVTQLINVSMAGWYIFRCNGFSNSNGQAKLIVEDFFGINYGFDPTLTKSVPLKPLAANGPKDLLEAGKAFYKGEYENEIRFYISQTYLDKLKLAGIDHTTLTFGIKVEGGTGDTSKYWTAFDNFRMLYAEDGSAPELVLDEENPNLNYLKETIEEYQNTRLHLNRTFTLNKWNTLILPVSLTYGQMKRAFGDDMTLAKLYQLTDTSVRFKTIECASDDDTMLEAYTPYILKPTKAAENNEAYTTPRLKKTANQYWLGRNVGITDDEDGITRHISGYVSIPANHYIIEGVSLDRTQFTQLDNHWVSTITTSTPTESNHMICKGTMAKTFYNIDGKGYFYTDNGEKRDNLAGDYFLKNGSMIRVPANKQYGLKAFRCWFEQTNPHAPAKSVSLYVNGIKDGTTGIADIVSSAVPSHPQEGVYNLQGQRLRQSTSLDGLPHGIYLVNGIKIKK